MNVKLKVNVDAAGLPADLIIRDYDGNIVFYKRFIRRVSICTFCTIKRNLIVSVRPLDADYDEQSKFIRFPCAKCVCAELFFGFVSQKPYEQTFNLLDKNYGFPILNAILTFSSEILI